MNPIQPRQWETTFKGEDFNRDKIINAESMHSDCLDTECCDNSMGKMGDIRSRTWDESYCYVECSFLREFARSVSTTVENELVGRTIAKYGRIVTTLYGVGREKREK